VSVTYSAHHGPIALDLVAEIEHLSESIFDPPAIDYAWRLTRMPEVSVFCARQAEALVGFKAGYATAEGKYYSWLGAVRAELRNQGVASRLASMQHEWLQGRGYRTVETSSRSGNVAMARVNLKSGFVVVGSKLEPHGLQVLWSKRLG
jgi:ribosomal protein S18 acetylase RimI-like enzyme